MTEDRLAALELRVEALEKALAKKAPDTLKEGQNAARVPTTAQSKRVADIFHRRHTTPWSQKEIRAYKKLGTIPEDDLSLLEAYYKSGAEYLRRDLMTFLNNFQGELDRATAWKKEGNTSSRNGSHPPTRTRPHMTL